MLGCKDVKVTHYMTNRNCYFLVRSLEEQLARQMDRKLERVCHSTNSPCKTRGNG
jgi:hypothetical protein